MRIIKLLQVTRVAGLAIIVPGLAAAQLAGSVVVTPYVGLYTPSTNLGDISASAGGNAASLKFKHQTAAAFGANVSYWFNERFALEGGAAYVASDLKGTAALNELGSLTAGSETQNAHLWLGSAKVMVQLLPAASDFNLRFGIGPAIISRGGTAYKEDAGVKLTGLTDYGAAMSLCSRLPLTRSVAIRLRAEDYMYQSKIGWRDATDPTANFDLGAKMQHDFVFSAGLQLFMNR